MKTIAIAAFSLVLAISFGAAKADPWKDESGHGRDHGEYSRHWDRDWRDGRERKVEYDDGRCKVERKLGKHGEYKEERKCRGWGRSVPGYGSSYPPYGYVTPPYGYYR
jgi:hypothetical protein